MAFGSYSITYLVIGLERILSLAPLYIPLRRKEVGSCSELRYPIVETCYMGLNERVIVKLPLMSCACFHEAAVSDSSSLGLAWNPPMYGTLILLKKHSRDSFLYERA